MTETATPTSVLASVKSDWTWLKTHLILVGVLLASVVGAVYGVESIIGKHDSANAAKYAAIAAQADLHNQQYQAQVEAQIKTLIDNNQQLANQNATLAAALSKRATIEVNIPKQVGTLTATDVASQLGGTATGDIVNLPLPQAQKALTDELLLPQLQADKTDLQSQLKNETDIASNNFTLYSKAQYALDSEKDAHVKDNTANAAQIKSLKADARKGKLKWFVIGFVSGYVARVVTIK